MLLFSGCTGLQVLRLAENQIATVNPTNLANLAALQELYLHRNQITTLGRFVGQYGGLAKYVRSFYHVPQLPDR